MILASEVVHLRRNWKCYCSVVCGAVREKINSGVEMYKLSKRGGGGSRGREAWGCIKHS